MENYFNITDVTSFWAHSQVQLHEAFINRDIFKFRSALKQGANPLATIPTEQDVCVLFKALQTSGCSLFVEACMRCSHKPTNLNDFYKKAIHFACASEDCELLLTLYRSSDVKIRRKYFTLFALTSLAWNWGISQNVPDQEEMTPLHYVVINNNLNEDIRRKIVKMFLSQSNIDIDTFRGGELRRILERKYPDVLMPMKITTVQSLKNRLIAGNLDLFVQQYTNNLNNINENEKWELLLESIIREAHKAFVVILSSGVNYNKEADFSNAHIHSNTGNSSLSEHYEIPMTNFTAFQVACKSGNTYALEKLLQMPDIRIDDNTLQQFIPLMIYHVKFSVSLYQNYWDCFQLLLDSGKIDINSIDQHKRTALHYAIEYQKDELIKILLKKGAYINVGKGEHELPLNSLQPSLLEQHLDDCITSNNLNLGEKAYEIKISFKNFITSQQRCEKKLKEVLTPIQCMVKSKEHCYLLQHPVISSILHLKWQKVSQIFYINFLLSLFFIASIIAYIVLNFSETKHGTALNISYICSCLGITYLLLRECLQFILAPCKYLKSFTNYLEILLIIFSILICYYKNRDLEVACILLLAFELLSLVGSLPIDSISTHMLMLKTVSKSFAKCFLFYSIFLFTFTLCFYIKSDEASKEKKSVNRFSDPLLAFFKTIVMFIGEIDAEDLNLNSGFNCLLFLSFIFFMTIILFNLLNGLAVSDTQAIRNQAELNGVICRSNLLSGLENVYIKWSEFICCMYNPFDFVPNYTTDIEVIFRPNDKNKIISHKTISSSFHNWFHYLSNRCPTMDKHTSVRALAILKRKSAKNEKVIRDEKLNLILKKLSFKN
ncbi:transient receptor potential cation channel protein painless-like [Lucilia sericata]|uniref:transient receptor potential cation channel protein painless-like n=1 Tax=Lucilia sericata TaxID=13632 RepID=UPI0018A82274|nr:transient receptor potential cation channel protein painless-like [Lucilia sericata]XP_037822782.1 transient receptor potential cation channel protein painless-like [Lucilia sericata]